jgi:hypothetical protein
MMRAKVHGSDGVYDLGVAPDYAFAVGTPDRRFRTFLVECDRGTMPVERETLVKTSLKRKLLTYASAKQRGVPAHRVGIAVDRVVAAFAPDPVGAQSAFGVVGPFAEHDPVAAPMPYMLSAALEPDNVSLPSVPNLLVFK